MKPAAAAAEAAIGRAAGLARSGRMREAIDLLQRDPAAMAHPAGCNVLGMLLMQAGASAPALAAFDRAVALAPGFADAHSNRGVALQQLGRLEEALAAFQAALRSAPAHVNALTNSGSVLKLLGRNDEAVQAFDRVLSLKPDLAEAVLKRAYVHMERQDHEAALADFARVMRLEPGRSEAALGRVSALISLRRFDEALAGTDRIIAARPDDADAAVARGQLLTELDRPADALDLAEGLLKRGRGGSKAALVRATALWRLGRRAEAIAAGEQAMRTYPADMQIRQALSQYYLATGDFAHGWEAYEFRADAAARRQDSIEKKAPRWRGEDLAGKTILVFTEQGIGDTIQFARFLSRALERGARVKVLVQSSLLGLAALVSRAGRMVRPGERGRRLRLSDTAVEPAACVRHRDRRHSGRRALSGAGAGEGGGVARSGSARPARASESSGRAIRATARTTGARCRSSISRRWRHCRACGSSACRRCMGSTSSITCRREWTSSSSARGSPTIRTAFRRSRRR